MRYQAAGAAGDAIRAAAAMLPLCPSHLLWVSSIFRARPGYNFMAVAVVLVAIYNSHFGSARILWF